ncbi:MAG: Ig-like domain-containing protein [Patescibacteria group bacterium]
MKKQNSQNKKSTSFFRYLRKNNVFRLTRFRALLMLVFCLFIVELVLQSAPIRAAEYRCDTGSTCAINSATPGIDSTTDVYVENNSTLVISGTTEIQMASLTVQAGSIVTHTINGTSQAHVINFNVIGNAIIDGEINADTRGFSASSGTGQGTDSGAAGGAGHGGRGGNGSSSAGGNTYGSVGQPATIGSGGGNDTNYSGGGGRGGGAIKLAVGGTLVVDGLISSDGAASVIYDAGGGSGGSVWIEAGTFAGSGSITANGGAGHSGGAVGGGGGGGGRIALYYTLGDLSALSELTAYGGGAGSTNVHASGDGGAGTIVTRNMSETYGDLLVDNNSHDKPATTNQVAGSTETYESVTVTNGSKYVVSNTASLTINTGGLFAYGGAVRTSLTIETGGTFNPGYDAWSFDDLNFSLAGTLSGVTDLTVTNSDFLIYDTAVVESNLDLTIGSGATVTRYGTGVLALHDLNVLDFGMLTHAINTTTRANVIDLEAANITIESNGSIISDGAGYSPTTGTGQGSDSGAAGGAGHGGRGGNGSSSAGGITYGSVSQPDTIGSGGGNDTNYSGGGGRGGGAIKLAVAGTLVVDGVVSSDGADSTIYDAGGGSGGSVWIEADTVTGSGSITANGGVGNSGGVVGGGGGGGGRIALYYASVDLSGLSALTAYGGGAGSTNVNASGDGGAGSIYLKLTSETYGDLLIDNGSNDKPASTTQVADAALGDPNTQNYADVTLGSGVIYLVPDTFFVTATDQFEVGASAILELGHDDGLDMTGDFIVRSGGTLRHSANTTTKVANIEIAAGSIEIEYGGSVNADALGFTSGNGPGVGGNVSSGGAGGAGFGGQGGTGTGVGGTGGTFYGSELSPIDLGSGGGKVSTTVGGSGGGQVRLDAGASGTITVDGTISANGSEAVAIGTGGGSGGSVYLTAGTFAGGGIIRVNGGIGQGTTGGCGAGGRIAHSSEVASFSGAMTATGACAGEGVRAGNDGTVNSVLNTPQINSLSYLPVAPVTNEIITITVEAEDNLGIAKIEVYLDGSAPEDLVDTCTYSPTENPATCDIDIGPFDVGGSHSVTAVAYDEFDNTASDSASIDVENAVPTITVLSPDMAIEGSVGFTLTINGTGFVTTSVVRFDGVDRTTNWVSAGTVTATITSGNLATAGIYPITVYNPAPGGGTSGSADFLVVQPPTVDEATHSPASPTNTDEVTLSGTASDDVGLASIELYLDDSGLVSPVATCNYAGTTPETCTHNAGVLTYGSHRLDVVATDTDGATDQATHNFIVDNPLPVLTSLDPSSAIQNSSAFTLTVNGSDFIPDPDGAGPLVGSVVRWQGVDQATTFVDENTLTVFISADKLTSSGAKAVVVFTEEPGGGTSDELELTVIAPPTIDEATHTPTSASTFDEVTLSGTASDDVGLASIELYLDDAGLVSPVATCSYAGTTPETCTHNAGILTYGSHRLDVVATDTQSATAQETHNFTVDNPLPVLSSISPNVSPVNGDAFILAINGSQFVDDPDGAGPLAGSVVRWQGVDQATTFVDENTLTVFISADKLTSAGSRSVTVFNEAPGGGESTSRSFTITSGGGGGGGTVIAIPDSPTAIVGEALSATTIRWYFTDNSSTELGFRIIDMGNGGTTVAEQSLADLTYLDETGLAPDTLYCHRNVVAFNGGGVSTIGDSQSFDCVRTLEAQAPVIDVGNPFSLQWATARSIILGWDDAYATANANYLFGVRVFETDQWGVPIGDGLVALSDEPTYLSIYEWGEQLDIGGFLPENNYGIWLYRKQVGQPDSAAAIVWQKTFTTQEEQAMAYIGRTATTASLQWDEDFYEAHGDKQYALHDLTFNRYVGPEAGGGAEYIMVRDAYFQSLEDWGELLTVLDLQPETEYVIDILEKDPADPNGEASVVWTLTVTTEEQSVVSLTDIGTRDAVLSWDEDFAAENSDAFFAFYETTTGQWLVPETVAAAGFYQMAALFEGEEGTEEDLVKLQLGEHPFQSRIAGLGINMQVGALTPATPYQLNVLRFENLYDSGLGSKEYYPQIVWILTMETEEEYVEFLVNKQLLGWDIEKSFDADGQPQDNYVYFYDIYIENIGNYNADEVILIDPIPEVATYRPNTITSDGVPQTDAIDGDHAHYWGEHPETLRAEVRWFWDNLAPGEYHEVQLRLDVPVFESVDIEYYNVTVNAVCGVGHPNAGGDCSGEVTVGHEWTDFGLITRREFDDPNTGVHWSVDYLPITPNYSITNGSSFSLGEVSVTAQQNIGFPYVANSIVVDGASQTDANDGDRGYFSPANPSLQKPAMAAGWPTMPAITENSRVVFSWPSLSAGTTRHFSYSADYINYEGREAPPDIQNQYQKIFCGDGFIDSGEVCDDGVLNGTLGYCTTDCDWCGNGIAEANYGESCDDGALNGQPGYCPSTCKLCGNGKVETGEQCDRGEDNGDSCTHLRNQSCEWCTTECKLNDNECGNKTVEPGEQCDLGDKLNGNVCIPAIGATCTYCTQYCHAAMISCGNGIVDGDEQCDRGYANGIVCDPPEGGGTCDFCTSNCTIATNLCGNGIADAGEQCDLGTSNDVNCAVEYPGAECSWCTRFCEVDRNVCGDMIKDQGEECDWGDKRPRTNYYNGAGCTPQPGQESCDYCTLSCTIEEMFCGNGIIDADQGEECDAGNGNGVVCDPPLGGGTCDYCGNGCKVQTNLCGNATLDAGEQCDLGADNTLQCTVVLSPENPDGDCTWCTRWCKADLNRCGDGIQDDGEECDRGEWSSRATTWNGKMCFVSDGADSCTWCTEGCTEAYGFCGNGVLEPEKDEQCDAGSANGTVCDPPLGGGTCEYCASGCQIATNLCGNGIVDTDSEQCDLGAFNGQDCSVEITPENPTGRCDYCSRYCKAESHACGDGFINRGEECDNGSSKRNPKRNGMPCTPSPGQEYCTFCNTDCEEDYRYCGNGIVNPGEQCDWGAQNGVMCKPEIGSTCSYCSTSCWLTENLCGNGVLDEGESCDAGFDNNQQCEVRVTYGEPEPLQCRWCNDVCEQQVNSCGDGTLDPGEWCDWGENKNSKRRNGTSCNPPLGDYCEYCEVGCFLEKNYCGNGVYEPEQGEGCDNGTFNGEPCKPGVGVGCSYCSKECLPIEMPPLSMPDLFIINLRAMDWLLRGGETEYIVEPPDDIVVCEPGDVECEEEEIIICEEGDIECEEEKERQEEENEEDDEDNEIIICEPGDVECEEEKERQEDEKQRQEEEDDERRRREDDLFDVEVPIPNADPIRSTDRTPVLVIEANAGQVLYLFLDGRFLTAVVADVNGFVRYPINEELAIGSHVFRALSIPTYISASDESAAAALGLVGVNLALALGARGLLSALWALFTQPALLLGRKRKKLYGTVFNSLTRRPIDLATVRLFDVQTGRPIAARVTDNQGRYLLKAQSGQYLVDVKKLGFNFPTQYIRSEDDAIYPDVLIGDQFNQADDGLVSKNVPLDPNEVERTPFRVHLRVMANKLKHVVALSGPALSVFAFVLYPSVTMLAILALHAFLYWFFRKFGYLKPPKRYGFIKDAKTGRPVEKAYVRIFDKKYNKLLETQITDSRGRYAFLVGKNTYYITVDKSTYESHRSGDLVRDAELESYIVEDFRLQPSEKNYTEIKSDFNPPPVDKSYIVGPNAPIVPIDSSVSSGSSLQENGGTVNQTIEITSDKKIVQAEKNTDATLDIPFEIAIAQQAAAEDPVDDDGIQVMPDVSNQKNDDLADIENKKY